jgi:hypothetical protein
MSKSSAVRVVRAIAAPVPQTGGGTLYVEGVPAVRMDDHEYVRRMVATYCLRVALEKGCTRIVVRHPTRQGIAFDVVDLLTATARQLGYWPRPAIPKVPATLATVGMLARGSELAPVRPQIAVPASFTLSPPVSGLDPGGKEN